MSAIEEVCFNDDGAAVTSVQKPLRVLYCIDAMDRGGTELQLAALIEHLDRRRVAPVLCTLRGAAADVPQPSCPSFEARFTSFASPGLWSCVQRLRRFVDEQRIDVVHAFFQDPVILGFLASAGRPATARVASLRDMGFWRTPGKLLRLRLVYPRYHGFIANSRSVAERFHELAHISLEKIAVISNGVRPCAARSRTPGADAVVGIVANLNREVKRVDLFLRAARLVADSLPGTRFVIVGGGRLERSLRELCSTLRLDAAVSFRGEVPDPETEVRSFDLGVLTSDSEGLSNSILEYMAAGIPTVARRVGGNDELVAHGETGLLVDGESPREIARAILLLLNDPQARACMGERARTVARTQFGLDACARKHEAYYADLVSTRQAAGARGTKLERRWQS